MKNLKIIKIVSLSLTLAFLFSNCTKKETEHKYSCNPEVDEFVKDWISVNSSILRSEITEFGFDSQRAVYATLTPSNRLGLWIDKVQHLQVLSYFNSSQRAAFDSLETIMVVEGFDNDSTNDTSFDSDFSTWQSSYGSLFDSLEFAHSFWKLDNFHKEMSGVPYGGLVSGCECSTESDWCSPFGGAATCETGGCSVEGRCGTFWQKKCNGLCNGGGVPVDIVNY